MNDNKLEKLTEKDVWIFTKQSVDFDNAFKSVKLINEMPNRDTDNIERYFSKNHSQYGIEKGNHRVLIIAQLFGLLTKTPPYTSGGSYNEEKPTEMFELLDKCEFGSKEYNKLKTEQVLKVKIRAITDVAKNNVDWNILPVIFIYKVLRTLKDQYNIGSISVDLFYTYVMTCSEYSEVNAAVEYIRNNSPITEYLEKYKDRSRFLKLVDKNINLFKISKEEISINEKFNNYFNDNFIKKIDIGEINGQLSRGVDYTYFLTSFQNFGINLIDEGELSFENQLLPNTTKSRKKKIVKIADGIFEDDDNYYVNKVNEIKEYNINETIVKDAYKSEPKATISSKTKRYSKNPLIGKVAIKQAAYKCENNASHETFMSSKTNEQFMEAHHLIPISLQDEIWNKYSANIDSIENIVSLCPNCHRAIHYARKEDKKEFIAKLYNIQKEKLEKIGVTLTLEEFWEIYGIR